MSDSMNAATLALVPKMARLTSGGDPPHTDIMEARVAKLETFADDVKIRLERIETKLDHTATREDISKMEAKLAEAITGQIKWIVGTAVALGAIAITVMTFVLNNASPKVPMAQPAPTVIVVPGPLPAASR